VTPIPQMCLRWSAVPRCALLRLVLLIAPCARPMELDSVRLKSWDGCLAHRVRPIITRDQISRALRMAQAMVTRGCDQLCLLIRKYELDPTLVKRYAADFCGTEAIRDANRDLVEAFISTLAGEAARDRASLICKLNSYNQLEEVKS
jgi:hypothetical protein